MCLCLFSFNVYIKIPIQFNDLEGINKRNQEIENCKTDKRRQCDKYFFINFLTIVIVINE